MTLRCAAAVIAASAWIAHPAAAEPGAALAAPGDCATPIADFVAPPVYGQSAGVPGPASEHFAPASGPVDVQRLLPIDLTRTTTAAVTTSVNLVESTTTGVGSLTNQTLSNANTIVNDTFSNVNTTLNQLPLEPEPINTLTGITRNANDLGNQGLGIVNDTTRALGLGGN